VVDAARIDLAANCVAQQAPQQLIQHERMLEAENQCAQRAVISSDADKRREAPPMRSAPATLAADQQMNIAICPAGATVWFTGKCR
jgi:hypothetical protein